MQSKEISFLTIYRNLVIKNYILYHLKMLNIHFHKRIVTKKSMDYQNREYLRSVVLYYQDDVFLLNTLIKQLPRSVRTIQLAGKLDNGNLLIIPSNIKTLRLGDNIFDSLVIPETLESLDMGSLFKSLIGRSSNFFPTSGLVYLNLGSQFNDNLKEGVLPTTLKTLKLGSFKENNEAYFPKSITDLDFGDGCRNLKLSSYNLPPDLVKLRLGKSFNGPLLPGSLPNSLKKLILPEKYQGEIKQNTFPLSITSLKFELFDDDNPGFGIEPKRRDLDLGLLVDLKSLQFGSRFKAKNAPSKLYKFSTFSKSFSKCFEKMPKEILSLEFLDRISNTKNLDLGLSSINVYSLVAPSISKYISIPETVKHLTTRNFYVNPHKTITNYSAPKHVVSFRDIYHGHDGKNRDYSKLTKIKALSTYFTYNYEKFILPTVGNLKLLELNYIFAEDFLMAIVPSSVETLIIRGAANIKLPLPKNITSIYISSTNYHFLNNISFRKEPDLMEIIKVIDDSNDIFKKLIKDL
ncbi:hypothetical protein DICPUDRAFT_83702 [Dictyostelium purpureum]|uniref:FNIP repeat-containing protein n=1 Tax=Dictyostelium purpureum TaxID=5786 RepID=F1A0C6_DICPU|nr:uncharacterized protein DICPUDRAFT_83702 [Dictyostelium purpureum]EGC30355.1 hypothetical protein DICPUDRAFT_83702 [Dictyostelium purpureum]|eukprot:XP_003293125.1 hypothetical protein DICPUDRAFT_83702 [Dictyostelium purpureum]